MNGEMSPQTRQHLLDLFSSDAWVSKDGVIQLSNDFLKDRFRDLRAWDDPTGHAFWELFDGNNATLARKAYDDWRASGQMTVHFGVTGPDLTQSTGTTEVHLFHMGPFEMGVMVDPSSVSGVERVRNLDTYMRVFQSYMREAKIGMIIFEEVAPSVDIIKQMNQEAADILEQPLTALIGRNVIELITSEEQEQKVSLFEQRRQGKQDLPYIEARVITGKGETITVEAVLGDITWYGRPAGFVMFKDVTERSLMFAELRRYAQAFELLQDTVVLADGSFNILYVNPAGLERSGYSIDEVVGKYVGVFGGMGKDDKVADELMRKLIHDGSWQGEVKAFRRDGTDYPVDIVVTFQRDPEGHPQMVTVVSRDISTRKASERSLRRARERAEFFTDLMSHDINNYIQGIMGRLELLSKSDLSQEQVRHVNRAIEQALKTSDLTARVRKISQAQHAGALLPIDLIAVVNEALEDLRLKWKDRAYTVRGTYPPARAVVLADELLKDLVINILDNAIKHSPQASDIEVRAKTRTEGRRTLWRLEVADHGPGIPDAQKDEVFFRFVRKGSAEGSGLGLSLVMALTERYNGRVWIEDRVPGEHSLGTRVVLELPAA